jgi:hypothetical protein
MLVDHDQQAHDLNDLRSGGKVLLGEEFTYDFGSNASHLVDMSLGEVMHIQIVLRFESKIASGT